ncbi:LysE family translocator [Rhodococcus sp. H29-C3]|uniref:LysE family translocator n=1 Tax=Rhodococcus sp. H29-C3 TaxID=3046307 RepID=UPI0024B8A0B5|nr:LysE family translocator [Rhodococcus sp. H29-C3]MDJ0360021.1 LysE family translocator [Rhodococcus sp. H29-C3]
MVTMTAAAGVFAVAMAMVLTPGPNMVYLVSRSISQGRVAGLVSLGGVGVGLVVYVVATNLGLAAMFAAVPTLYTVIKVAGACYLAWLGWTALRGSRSVFEVTGLQHDSNTRLFTMGLLTNLLNPKMAVMYISIIPQFIDPAAGSILMQGLALGGVQILVGLTVNALIVLAAGSIAMFLSSRPSWIKLQRYVTGTVLGLLAVRLAADPSRPVPA